MTDFSDKCEGMYHEIRRERERRDRKERLIRWALTTLLVAGALAPLLVKLFP